MLGSNIILAVIGLSAGILVAGGLFSFIIGLGVISDFADRTHTGEHILLYTFDAPEIVKPEVFNGCKVVDNKLVFTIPACSVLHLEVTVK